MFLVCLVRGPEGPRLLDNMGIYYTYTPTTTIHVLRT